VTATFCVADDEQKFKLTYAQAEFARKIVRVRRTLAISADSQRRTMNDAHLQLAKAHDVCSDDATRRVTPQNFFHLQKNHLAARLE